MCNVCGAKGPSCFVSNHSTTSNGMNGSFGTKPQQLPDDCSTGNCRNFIKVDYKQEEPCGVRVSSTVPWERKGEIPLRDPIMGYV
jgi:hypothetical protein